MDKNLRNLLKLILLPLLLTVCLTAVSQVQDTLTEKGDTTVTSRYKFTKKDYIPKVHTVR